MDFVTLKNYKILRRLMSARTQQEMQNDNSVCAMFLKRKIKYSVQKQFEMVT